MPFHGEASPGRASRRRPAVVLLLCVMGPVVWQPALSQPAMSPASSQPGGAQPDAQPAAPAQSPAPPEGTKAAPVSADPQSGSSEDAPPESAYRATSGKFQVRIDAVAAELRATEPRFKNLPPKYVPQLVEFVAGNMLFVLLHEMAHTAITELGLPVLGRMEDAADTFAALRLIRIGSDFSQRVLVAAAKGWFLADKRDRKTGDTVNFYDEHGLNQQRAYQIVCLMVGSDDEKFKGLATEVKLPEERQDTCAGDFSNAAYSWDRLLKPFRRAPDQPKTKIDVVYGPAEGRNAIARKVVTSLRLLETVAGHMSDELTWPRSFTLEFKSCGYANARWDLPTHKLTLCYELGADFADLFRDYGGTDAKSADSAKRKTVGAPAFRQNRPNRSNRKHR